MTRLLFVLFFVLCAGLFVLFGSEAAAQSNAMDRLDVFLETWDLRTHNVQTHNVQPDETYREGRGRSTVYRALDGVAQQDDCISLISRCGWSRRRCAVG